MGRSSDYKYLFMVILLGATRFVLSSTYFPYRANTDQRPKVPDLVEIVQLGRLIEPSYRPGVGFQMMVGQIIQVLGIQDPTTSIQWLSPAVAAVGYGVYCCIMYSILRRHLSNVGWTIVGPAAAFWVFATYPVTYRETSHKVFVITMALLMFYSVYRISAQENTPRFVSLIICFGLGISNYNYIWGIIYGGGIGLAIAISGINDRRQHILNLTDKIAGTWRAVIITGIIYCGAFGYVLLTPSLKFHRAELVGVITSVGGIGSTSTRAVGRATIWPQIEFIGIVFPSVIIWMTGIWVMLLLSVFAFGRSLYRFLRQPKAITAFEEMYVGMCTFFGLFAIALIARRDLPTIRRLAKFVGSFTAVYWGIMLSYKHNNMLGKRLAFPTNKVILLSIIILLVLSTVLATPRIVQNGGETLPTDTPLDTYFDDEDVAKAEFYQEFGNFDPGLMRNYPTNYWAARDANSCLRTYDDKDHFLMGQVVTIRMLVINSGTNPSQVYDGGSENKLACIGGKN